ncbi:hypothetical protein PP7435_CHR3-2348 [Komagataella phaffii CBS 7435]|nr:hypothetical protein BQ9382_C3-4546 [Komagataella phaffii CBS 7435]SCV12267.1 hypothetical protein PP7435_CHR3-2348 [Komagataella phaffii CBS 7435]
MTTGLYMVCDIKCHQCKKVIGWEYLSADDDTQQFKVGKFILEANGIIYVQ